MFKKLKKWLFRNDLADDILNKSEKSIKETQRNQERVDTISIYLNERRIRNGFGEDFEYTLRPRKGV